MQREQIIITIDAAGEAQVEVNGCAGPSCADLTKRLESALGETVKDTKTHEYQQARSAARETANHRS